MSDVRGGPNADLLFPGPQPPLTHLGATLLRHVVAGGLRYALYHLGQPLPEKPPLRIERLRLFLDGPELRRLLEPSNEGALVVEALLDPGGSGGAPHGRLRGAAWFHRLRLRHLRAIPRRTAVSGRAAPVGVPEVLRAVTPALRAALLVEVLEALDRRARRGHGVACPAVASPGVRALGRGETRALERLGPPDPFVGSWAASGQAPTGVQLPQRAADDERRGSRRGVFRESYRVALDRLRPALCAFGEAAAERRVLERPDDLFFLPFELLDSLDVSQRPSWVDHSVLRNRGEYFQLVRDAEPAEERAWTGSPLTPLP